MDWPAEGTRETVRVAEGLAEVTCMGADGNCLFHAVSHQLRAVGGVQDAAELRRQAAAYIRANPDRFEAALDAAAVDDPQGYALYKGEDGRLVDIAGAAGRLASRLETDSEWAGEEALVALAAVYQTRIEVYYEARPGDAPPCRTFAPPDVRPGPPLRVVYRLSRAGDGQRVHYDSLQSCTPAPTEEERMSTSAQPGSGPQRDPVPADGQPRMPEELQEVVLALGLGPMSPGRLTGALLLAMRRGNEEHFVELCNAVGPAVGRPALEDCLDEAWRKTCALNLPLSEDMKQCVVRNLTLLRYQDPTSDAPPAADAHVRWHELWRRVDLLLEYSRRLQDELQRLQGHDRAPGSADKSVMLARMCALAVHNVKGSFLSTYKDVPWEEMEYLLVMFIEARTVFVTLAHLVATASTAAHLQCFRERVGKYVLVHRAEPDPEAAMKRLKKESQKGSTRVDSALRGLRKDFQLLRGWHSLKEINRALGVTCEALSLQDTDWAAWGWLALRWALFVVGERVKYSWTSPNLSPRWAVLMEAIAPGGVLEVMSAVRDDQEHGEEGSNAKTLALPKMTESKRKELAEELQKLTRAARAALGAAEGEVEWTDDRDWEGRERVTAAKTDSEGRKDLIGEELLKILRPAKHKAELSFEAISTLVYGKISHFKHSFLTSMSVLFALKHIPEAVPRVCRLLFYKSAEHTESFQAELRDVTPSVSSPLDTLRRAVTALAAAPEGKLSTFAIHGALREVASRWHEHDKVVPTDLPFSPALFGRQLRNYLNHLDEIFRSLLELQALYTLLHNKLIPLELEHGARPRPRDPRWSRAENERLLRLVELKSDMFRCAREGHLFWLQRLVEDGADVSARDCQDRTLLHAAAQGGQVHVVRWLLGLGAGAVDPLAKDWCGHTALHVARTAAVVEELLAGIKTVYSDLQQTCTPLHLAAVSGRAEVVAVLLRDPRDLDAVDHNGRTPLHFAARHGHDQVVRLLLAAGARCQADADGLTPLVLAACSGSARTVRLLLGAALPKDCWRAAGVAAGLAREEACSALLDELEARGLLQWGPEAREVLLQAGCGGSSAITLRLLDLSTAALGERLDDTGRTVLHVAAYEGRAELVRALLSRGEDPLGEAAEGATALDWAAQGGSTDTITALVERIPGGSLQAALGRPLCGAALRGQLGAAQRLVHHGAVVNAVDGEGHTPLGCAALGGHTEVVRWLLLRGANPRLGEHPPLHYAAAYGSLGVVKLLVPPLHAGDQGQGDPGGEEPGPEDILKDSRFWLLLMTRPERKAEESAEKRRRQEARKAQDAQAEERLGLLQPDSEGRTPLHRATFVSALPVVEYLLKREEELLRYVHSLGRPTGVPTVYARDANGHTALQYGAMELCAPSVAEALLKMMEDEVWLALGHRDLQEVRGMAVEALKKAVHQPGGGRLVRALCEWLLGVKKEDKKKDKKEDKKDKKKEDRLQDIRLAAVAALCSGPDEEWRAVVDLVSRQLEARPLNLADLQVCAVLAMRPCLQLGPRGVKALQLLSLWVRDISGLSAGAADETHKRVVDRIAAEALRIAVQRRDQHSFQVICRFLWGAEVPAVVLMMWVSSLLS